MSKTTILVLASNPLNTKRLNLLREIRTISEALRGASHRDEFAVHSAPAARFKDAYDQLLDLEDVILHFSGHGRGEGGLVFEDDEGYSQEVALEPFAGILRALPVPIRCVVLNACYSAQQAEQIRDFIPYVVGTMANIDDHHAIEFSEAFYKALFSGKDIPVAFELSRAMLRVEDKEFEGLILYSDTIAPPAAEKPDSPAERMDQIRERYREATSERAGLSRKKKDTSEIDLEILDLETLMRKGPPLIKGDRLGGRFGLFETIGRGGYATVWRAYDYEQGEEVAVKILHGQYSEDRTRRDRFFLGARKMARLRHPGIVDVLEEELRADDHYFFVMEYLAGGDLERFIQETRPEPDACLDLSERIGEALAYAHQRELVHRDIKPANILLDADGRAKLTDFDLVWARDTSGITLTGDMLGTFGYMAPEAMKKAKEVDERADVYGLGMTAIFTLLQDHPDIESIYRKPESLIAGLPVAPSVRSVLARSITWSRADRTSSIDEFLLDLRAARKQPFVHSNGGDRAQPGSGGSRTVNGMIFLPVPGGEFILGSSELQDPDSEPVHRVVLSPFWIAATPVTNRQYHRFLQANPKHREPDFWNDATFNQPEQPVVGVSWHDAAAYASWAGSQLPSEAQWEAAARGTEQRPYPWGHTAPAAELANFGRRIGHTTAVEEYRAGVGPYGTLDQSGNVWEWCRDLWNPTVYQERDGSTDPVWEGDPAERGKPFVDERVLRGGSWANGAQLLHAACRYHNPPSNRKNVFGFRCILMDSD